MSRLLAVSWEMPPMYGPRATQVARTLEHLGALGWESTVICLAPRRGGPHWRDAQDPEPMPHVHRVGIASPEESAGARALLRVAPILRGWPDEKWMWIRRAARAAIRAAASERPRGLVTFAQPWSDHLVGLRVQRAAALPWVAHFSDPWVDSPYARGNAVQRRTWARMEADVVRHADALVFVNDQTADLVMRKYPDAWRGKVHVVPHGYDRRALPAPPPSMPPTRSASSVGALPRPLQILYTGRFYRDVRTPIALFGALARLQRERPLHDRIMVRLMGPHVEEYAADARRLGVDDVVRFESRQPARAAMEAAAAADVLLVIDAPSDGPSAFLPSKLVDYLMFRKPILALTPAQGASADLVSRVGGTIAPPGDEAAIASALSGLIECAAAGRLSVADRFDAVAAEYDIRCTTEQLHAALQRTFDDRHD
jgi:glycosyltransferase involved in cell wall biosynthesis